MYSHYYFASLLQWAHDVSGHSSCIQKTMDKFLNDDNIEMKTNCVDYTQAVLGYFHIESEYVTGGSNNGIYSFRSNQVGNYPELINVLKYKTIGDIFTNKIEY